MRRNYKNPIIAGFSEDGTTVYTDVNSGKVITLYEFDETMERTKVFRPLTKAEKREAAWNIIRYGNSGILCRIFKALRLRLTRSLYPQQGRSLNSGPYINPSDSTLK